MTKHNLYALTLLAFLVAFLSPARPAKAAGPFSPGQLPSLPPDSIKKGGDLPYPFNDETVMPGSGKENPMYLNNPSNLKTNVEYDPATRQYYYTYKIG